MESLRGLLAPSATPDPIERGKRAATMVAVVAGTERTRRLLVEWINTPDWQPSRQYLTSHRAELLTDQGEVALQVLLAGVRDDRSRKIILDHTALLRACRRVGIDAGYQQFLGGQRAWV